MKYVQYDDSILGEPEMLFKIDESNFVKLWNGSFNNLMALGKPQKDGKWDDFLSHFHLLDGYYDEPNWKVPSIENYRKSISDIEIPADNEDADVTKKVLLELFDYALVNSLPIYISYL